MTRGKVRPSITILGRPLKFGYIYKWTYIVESFQIKAERKRKRTTIVRKAHSFSLGASVVLVMSFGSGGEKVNHLT
jgi:hypothetical protein